VSECCSSLSLYHHPSLPKAGTYVFVPCEQVFNCCYNSHNAEPTSVAPCCFPRPHPRHKSVCLSGHHAEPTSSFLPCVATIKLMFLWCPRYAVNAATGPNPLSVTELQKQAVSKPEALQLAQMQVCLLSGSVRSPRAPTRSDQGCCRSRSKMLRLSVKH
jgi:hypothetical protein